MAVLPVKAKVPGDAPGHAFFLECGGNHRSIGDGALEAEGPPRRDWDPLSILSLLFPHPVKGLPVLLNGHAKA
jgi:hypothetical protein